MLQPLRPPTTLSKTETHPAHASAARYAAGRPARKIAGSASAAMSGIRSIRAASAPHAFTSGLRPSVSRAADGRRIRIGIHIREFRKTKTHEYRQLPNALR